MHPGLATELRRVAAQIFEELAFLLPCSPEGKNWTSAGRLAMRVRFVGPFRGTLVLRVEEALVPAIAGNMLVDGAENLLPQQQRDAVGELANVICGNILPRLAGPDAEFRLEAPEPADGEAPPGHRLVAATSLAVSDGSIEGAAEVRLYLGAGEEAG